MKMIESEKKRIRAAGNCGQAGSARRRGIVKGDKLSPLTRGIDYTVLKSKRNKQAAVRHLENKKTSSKL
ncbi:MAG: hypothetical protein PUB72_04005 [Ruminococcus sp.]|nr:hypothetical protein [Ruminococcus sp.]